MRRKEVYFHHFVCLAEGKTMLVRLFLFTSTKIDPHPWLSMEYPKEIAVKHSLESSLPWIWNREEREGEAEGEDDYLNPISKRPCIGPFRRGPA